jgi:hypothetical protein
MFAQVKTLGPKLASMLVDLSLDEAKVTIAQAVEEIIVELRKPLVLADGSVVMPRPPLEPRA